MYKFELYISCAQNSKSKTHSSAEFMPLWGVKERILGRPDILKLTSECNGCCSVMSVKAVGATGENDPAIAQHLHGWIEINRAWGNL